MGLQQNSSSGEPFWRLEEPLDTSCLGVETKGAQTRSQALAQSLGPVLGWNKGAGARKLHCCPPWMDRAEDYLGQIPRTERNVSKCRAGRRASVRSQGACGWRRDDDCLTGHAAGRLDSRQLGLRHPLLLVC